MNPKAVVVFLVHLVMASDQQKDTKVVAIALQHQQSKRNLGISLQKIMKVKKK